MYISRTRSTAAIAHAKLRWLPAWEIHAAAAAATVGSSGRVLWWATNITTSLLDGRRMYSTRERHPHTDYQIEELIMMYCCITGIL